MGGETHLYRAEEREYEVHGPYLESEASTSRCEVRCGGIRLVGKGEFPKDRVRDAINSNQRRAVTELERCETNTMHQKGGLGRSRNVSSLTTCVKK
jgi:hypothetical protein